MADAGAEPPRRPWRWRVADRFLPVPSWLDRRPAARYIVQRYVLPLVLAVVLDLAALKFAD